MQSFSAGPGIENFRLVGTAKTHRGRTAKLASMSTGWCTTFVFVHQSVR